MVEPRMVYGTPKRSDVTQRPDGVVVTAWAEKCSGPGWSNKIVWILIREDGGKLRLYSLQPEEQSHDIVALFDIAAAATTALTLAVEHALGRSAVSAVR